MALRCWTLQRNPLLGTGVAMQQRYEDYASGKRDDRPGLEACIKAARQGDNLITWKLDRLGRDLRHLVSLVHSLTDRGVGLKVLAGQGANLNTTASCPLVFGIFAALAEFERELIVERTRAGLASARARGRHGDRPSNMTPAKLRLAQAAIIEPGTKVSELCAELGSTRQTLYWHIDPEGGLSLTEARLRLATDAAEIGTWDLDVQTNVLTWSDRFYAGLHPDDREATSEAFSFRARSCSTRHIRC